RPDRVDHLAVRLVQDRDAVSNLGTWMKVCFGSHEFRADSRAVGRVAGGRASAARAQEERDAPTRSRTSFAKHGDGPARRRNLPRRRLERFDSGAREEVESATP